MINFRYHIVSLTAVLLALGIGLMLGTTFLDQATVDALKDRQAELESDVRRTNDRNSDQAAVIDEYEREASAFSEQIGERLFSGILRNDPVLVIATKGRRPGPGRLGDGGDDPGRRPAGGYVVAHRPAQARRRQRGRRHGRRAAAQHQRPRPPAHVAGQPAGRGALRGERPAARPGGRRVAGRGWAPRRTAASRPSSPAWSRAGSSTTSRPRAPTTTSCRCPPPACGS